MGRLIWNNKTIFEFDNTNLEAIISYCSLLGTKSIIDNENIIIFPALYDKTIVLKDLSNDNAIGDLINVVEGQLLNEGAVVITDEGFTPNSSLGYLDPQLLIAFNIVENDSSIRIFLPFEGSVGNRGITKQLLRHLSASKTTFKIASKWNKLASTKYWGYLFNSSIPTIIIEISAASLQEDLAPILIKAIIDEIGFKSSKEEEDRTLRLLDSLPEKIKNLNNKEEKEIEGLYIKLDSYKKELDELKKSFSDSANEATKKSTPDNTTEAIMAEEEKETEGNKPLIAKSSNSNKRRSRKKKRKAVYLPTTPLQSNRDGYNSNALLPYPIKLPGDAPIHQFKRPTPKSGRSALPPGINAGRMAPPYIPFHEEDEEQENAKLSTEKIVKDINELNAVLSQIKTYTTRYPDSNKKAIDQ